MQYSAKSLQKCVIFCYSLWVFPGQFKVCLEVFAVNTDRDTISGIGWKTLGTGGGMGRFVGILRNINRFGCF